MPVVAGPMAASQDPDLDAGLDLAALPAPHAHGHADEDLTENKAESSYALATIYRLNAKVEELERDLSQQRQAASRKTDAYEQRLVEKDRQNTLLRRSSVSFAPVGGPGTPAQLNQLVGTLQKQLETKASQAQDAQVQNDTLATRQQGLESEVLFHKRRYEKAVEKLTKMRNQEVQSLKDAFAEVSLKRKSAYIAMQKKMNAAIQLNTQTAAEKERLVAQVSQLQSQARTHAKQAESAKHELSQRHGTAVAAFGKEKSALERRVTSLSTELTTAHASTDRVEEEKARLQGEFQVAKEALEEIVNLDSADGSGLEARVVSQLHPPVNGAPVTLIPNPPGDYQVQWFRSSKGSLFQPIAGTHGAKYIPTADDIGAVLKGQARAADGAVVTAEVGPIECAPENIRSLTEYLKRAAKAELVLEVSSATPSTDSKAIVLTKTKIKLRNGKQTQLKEPYSHHLKVDLDPADPSRFKLQIGQKMACTYLAPRGQRDLYALILRLMNDTAVKEEPPEEAKSKAAIRYQIMQINAVKARSSKQDSQTLRALREQQDLLEGQLAGPKPADIARRASSMTSSSSTTTTPTTVRQPGKRSSAEAAAKAAKPAKAKAKEAKSKAKEEKYEQKHSSPDPVAGGGSGAEAGVEAGGDGDAGVQYDADGYIIRADEARGFDDYGGAAAASDSDEEEQEKKIKVSIRDKPMELPTSFPSISLGSTSNAKKSAGPLKKKADKKKKKKDKDKAETGGGGAPVAAAFDTAFGDVPAFDVAEASTTASVEAVICETINVKIMDAVITSYALRGEINLFASNTDPESDSAFLFKMPYENKLHRPKWGHSVTSVTKPDMQSHSDDDVYRASIAPGAESVCILKYIAESDLDTARNQVPLAVRVTWEIEGTTTLIKIEYAVRRQYCGARALTGVKFLIATSPAGVVKKCYEAQPKCFWNSKEKIRWVLPQLPGPGVTADSPDSDFMGQLVCKLDTTEPLEPSPVHVSFTCETDATVSGLDLVPLPAAEAQALSEGALVLPLAQTHYSLKTGLFDVE